MLGLIMKCFELTRYHFFSLQTLVDPVTISGNVSGDLQDTNTQVVEPLNALTNCP